MPLSEIFGCEANSHGLSTETINDSFWLDSLLAPALMPVAQRAIFCVPRFFEAAWSLPLVNVGASLTGFTVIVKVCNDVSAPRLAVPPLSFRRTATVAVPYALPAGVNVRVPFGEIAGDAEKSDGLL